MFRLVLIALVAASAFAKPTFRQELNEEWESFKNVHRKDYSEQEEAMRRMIWEDNVDYVQKHNLEADRGMHTYYVGINEYADMTNQEFRMKLNGYRQRNATESTAPLFLAANNVALPDTVDWRKEGYVTGVKNQGQCGSCWSFSATGSLEGQHFKKMHKLVSLSEQNLVDCSTKEGNHGCQGGLMDQAFEYIKMNKGIDTEESYPYEARNGRCRFKRENVGATDMGYVDIKHDSEMDLQKAVATVGPISVAIDAGHRSFQLYKRGVYNEPMCSQTRLDHGVLAIGYGMEDSMAYWLVKNSWGTSWGMEGYIMMSRNKNNQCGIATEASYPTV